MSKKYYIKPSEDKASFCALFKDDPDISSDQIPASLRIDKIEIDQNSNWTFYLNDDYFVSPELKESLKRFLAEAQEIYFVCKKSVQEETESKEFCPVDNWQEIADELAVALPTMNGFLSVKNLKFEEDILEIQLPSVVHANWLKDKGCQDLIAEILQRRMGRAVKVELSTFTVAEEEFEVIFPEMPNEIFVEEPQKAIDKFPKKKRSKKEPEEGALKGRRISADASSIDELEEGDRGVVLSGFIFQIDERELKNGSWLHTFSICDMKNSVNCKFLRYAEEPVVPLKINQWIKVRGDYQYDQFAKESILLVKDIEESDAPPIREDKAEMKRVELHLHTKMSAMDAISATDDLLRRASVWGHKACAITDHGVVQSFPDAFAAAKKHGVKPLFGVEGYLTDVESKEDASTYHICILAKNLTGLRRLYTLISRSHVENFRRHPRIARKWLEEDREGLIIGSACEAGELYQAIINGKSDEDLKRIASFYDYLEIMPAGNNEFMVRSKMVDNLDGIRAHNKKIYDLGKALGITVVATGDVHFLDPEDAIYRAVLMAGQGYEDFDLQAPLYFKTTDEMLEEFSYLGEKEAFEVVVENSNLIADSIDDLRPVPDELATPHIDGAEEEVRFMAHEKARSIYGDPLPQIVSARLERELKCIIDNGYAVIYLVAHKLVKKSLEDGYIVGSRGSVGSSLVATMCNITEVNPLTPHYICPSCKYSDFANEDGALSGYDLPDRNCPNCNTPLKKDGHDIPFEVFMGFEGDKNPDIDLNFSGEYQSKIHKYAEEIFGADNVFRAGTISTIAEKTAYGFARAYADKKGKNVGHAELSRLAKGCTGVKRTTGQHPGGIIVVPKTDSIFRFTPVQHPANDADSGVRTTHFDYKSLHDNLLKLDLLGHDDPTSIRMLEDITGIKISEIPMDDKETMAIFSDSSSLNLTGCNPDDIGAAAIPEFGTKFVRGMLKDTRPKTFAELIQISGLSHGTDVWLNNAQDLITSNTATLSQVITVRDDIMTYLIKHNLPPKASFKIMEQVRKGKGLTEEDEKLMRECSVPDWYIDSCKKIKYMFPKAHAVAYVMMAFRIAYFKVHYPEAFYATYFHICREDFDPSFALLDREAAEAKYQELMNRNDLSTKEKESIPVLEVVIEAIIRGIKFLRVDLMKSSATKFLIEEDGLRLPFVVIGGLGDAVANSLVEARAMGEFSSVENLKERTKLSKSHIESMRAMGVLEGMQETDQLSLF